MEFHTDEVLVSDPEKLPQSLRLKDPKECDFPFDEQQAISIAEDAGVGGLEVRVTSFLWNYGCTSSIDEIVTHIFSKYIANSIYIYS